MVLIGNSDRLFGPFYHAYIEGHEAPPPIHPPMITYKMNTAAAETAAPAVAPAADPAADPWMYESIFLIMNHIVYNEMTSNISLLHFSCCLQCFLGAE